MDIISRVCRLVAFSLCTTCVVQGCGPKQEPGAAHPDRVMVPKTDHRVLNLGIVRDTVIKLGGHEVEIRLPDGPATGTLLLLPGWNFNRTAWCEKSRVCERANAEGYVLVMPEMGKSMYAGNVFTETTAALALAPTRTWLSDTVFPHLDTAFGLLRAGDPSYVLGLSTGARGVALIVLDNPSRFKAGGGLSGDYDLPSMPSERVNIAMYGPYSRFPHRWRGAENPQCRVAELKTPIYLGHGARDAVVDVRQTLNFHKACTTLHPNLGMVLSIDPGASHDFDYWDSETEAIFAHFARFR